MTQDVGLIDQEKSLRGMHVLAVGLWIVTSVLAFAEIGVIIELAVQVYAAFWGDYGFYGADYYGARSLQALLAFPLGIGAVIVIIGGAEFHMRNFNTERSWSLFARTLAAEIAILVLAGLI